MTAVTTIVFKKPAVKELIIRSFCSAASKIFPTQMSDCIFCDIITGNDSADIFYQDDKIVVFKDIKPAAKFHLLSVPREHIANVKSLTSEHVELIESLIEKGKQALLEKGGDANDVRMGFHLPPFNSVAHLHLHVISPASDMSFASRLIFRPHSWWFASVEEILEKLGSTSKL